MYHLSSHARKRLQQRAMNLADVEEIVAHGTPVPGGYLLRARDANEEISELKGRIRMLERLKDRVVITDGQTVVTAYRASKRKQRWLLSTSRCRTSAADRRHNFNVWLEAKHGPKIRKD